MTLFGKEIDMLFIIAQLIGFVGTAFGIISYQSKRRARIIALQIASNIFWLVHYFLLGTYSAVVANFIGTIRNIIYSFRGKYRFADSKIIPGVCIVVFLITGAVTYTNPFDILPTFAMVVASVAFFIKKERIIRYLSVFVSVSWVVFSIYAGSIAGALADGITFVSIIVAIIRYRGFDVYEKTANDYYSAGNKDIDPSCDDETQEC